MIYLKDQGEIHKIWFDTAIDVDIDFYEAQQDERALMWVVVWGVIAFFAVGLAWLMLPMIMNGMKGGSL